MAAILEWLGSILSIVLTLALFVLVLFLAYKVTKFVGKGYTSAGGARGHIKILDRAVLGQDKMLVIVEVMGKAMLIGVTGQNIRKLCDIEGDLPELPPAEAAEFSTILQNTLKNVGKRTGLYKEKGEADDSEIK